MKAHLYILYATNYWFDSYSAALLNKLLHIG